MIIKMIEKKNGQQPDMLHGSFRCDGNWGGWWQCIEFIRWKWALEDPVIAKESCKEIGGQRPNSMRMGFHSPAWITFYAVRKALPPTLEQKTCTLLSTRL